MVRLARVNNVQNMLDASGIYSVNTKNTALVLKALIFVQSLAKTIEKLTQPESRAESWKTRNCVLVFGPFHVLQFRSVLISVFYALPSCTDFRISLLSILLLRKFFLFKNSEARIVQCCIWALLCFSYLICCFSASRFLHATFNNFRCLCVADFIGFLYWKLSFLMISNS